MKPYNKLLLLLTALCSFTLILASPLNSPKVIVKRDETTTVHQTSLVTLTRTIHSSTKTYKPLPTFTPVSAPLKCNQDNCLRQFIHQSSAVAGFCATYTKSVNIETTGLPAFVSQCRSIPSRISSACSCVATGVASASTSQPSPASTSTSSTDKATTSSISTSVQTSERPTPTVTPSTIQSSLSMVSSYTIVSTSISVYTPTHIQGSEYPSSRGSHTWPASSERIPPSTTSCASTLSTNVSTGSSSTSILLPTLVPFPTCDQYFYLGCYSEGTHVRALSGASYVNYTRMSVEICSIFCGPFTYFGLEYGGECWCGDAFGEGSVKVPEADCDFQCDGNPGEICGAGNRLNIYQCEGSGRPSHSTAQSSSTVCSSSIVSTLSTSTVQPSSSISASSTSTGSSSIASPSTWVTIPANDGIKSCVASDACYGAAQIHDTCMKASTNLDLWNCYCVSNKAIWFDWLQKCTTCIQNAMPPNVPSELPTSRLLEKIQLFQTVFCDFAKNDPTRIDNARYYWDAGGQDVATHFLTPVEFFNMTLVDQPIVFQGIDPPAVPVVYNASNTAAILASISFVHVTATPTSFSSAPLSTTYTTTIVTITSSSSGSSAPTSTAVSSASSSASNSQLTTASSTSSILRATTSSSAAPSVTPWSTIPANDEIRKCVEESEYCYGAGRVHDTCLTATTGLEIRDCFCTGNKAIWSDWASKCSDCIASAMPATVPNQVWPIAKMTEVVTYLQNAFCKLDANTTGNFQKHAVVGLIVGLGQQIPLHFLTPVEFYNMTLLSAPVVNGGVIDKAPLPLTYKGINTKTVLASISMVTPAPTIVSKRDALSISVRPQPVGPHMRSLKVRDLSPTPTPSPASAFPITPQMQACQYSVLGCKPAAQLYDQCTQNDPSKPQSDPTSTWSCLCKTYFAEWNATQNICSSCIAAALPKYNPRALVQADKVVERVNALMGHFCWTPNNQGLFDFEAAAWRLTGDTQSPLKWFGMEELGRPIEVGLPFQPRGEGPAGAANLIDDILKGLN